MLTATRFQLLNVEGDLQEVGWDDESIPKLWRYNLHYFDDLNARGNTARRAWHEGLVHRWISENPAGTGTGWEPYPTSLRIVNWIKWLLGGIEPGTEVLHSLAVQSRWLSSRLEFHLLGNHLFANAKALLFAGLFFEGDEALHWAAVGARIIDRELREQILADGGHFERSPMYHALALEDVLDLLNVLGTFAATPTSVPNIRERLADVASRMLSWLRTMCHPDGQLSYFNDCAQGIAPSLIELEEYAHRLGVRGADMPSGDATTLSPSGYVRLSRGAAVVLLDAAPVGPDYLPGHAHADTLSFELSLRGQRVVVNGGTSCYGSGARRQEERSTAAHSTVQVDGRNSSEVWHGFRVGRRARPFGLEVQGASVSCSHDGYRFLPGHVVHRRCWRLQQDVLEVDDAVSSRELPAVARYLIAPGLRAHAWRDGCWRIARDDRQVARVEVTCGRGQVVAASHAPEFGVLLAIDCLEVQLIDGCASVRWTWDE